TRVVIIPARGFPNAVTRNKCRRQTREAFREMKPRITPGFDLVVVSYSGDADYHAREMQLAGLLTRAGILSPRSSKEY
ncbi:MAG: ribonuclease P protein component, partial [Spirochaetales bacterium]